MQASPRATTTPPPLSALTHYRTILATQTNPVLLLAAKVAAKVVARAGRTGEPAATPRAELARAARFACESEAPERRVRHLRSVRFCRLLHLQSDPGARGRRARSQASRSARHAPTSMRFSSGRGGTSWHRTTPGRGSRRGSLWWRRVAVPLCARWAGRLRCNCRVIVRCLRRCLHYRTSLLLVPQPLSRCAATVASPLPLSHVSAHAFHTTPRHYHAPRATATRSTDPSPPHRPSSPPLLAR